MRTAIFLITIALIAGTSPAAIAQHRHGHTGHAAHGGTRASTPAVREFKAAHHKMMRNMAVPFTGDPDVDFRTHMIPHHQGAVDMSKVALRHAKDPRTRHVAEAISIAQPREIYEFRGWLANRGASSKQRMRG